MIKKLAKILFILLFFSNSSSADMKELTLQEISERTSNFISNLIPGEGDTEISIDFRENASPDYSILAVREIMPMDEGKLFTQFSFFNNEQNGDERVTGNLGFGLRKLSDDKTWLFGLNNFYDQDISEGHSRTSFGIEARSAVLDFHLNRYLALGHGLDGEKVLDGWDAQFSSQVPYYHWANVFLNSYKWEGEDRTDIEGLKYGSEMILNPNLILEAAYDDKELKGLEDQWYAKLKFIYPGREGPTALDGKSSSMWKEEKNMSGQMLTKVKRQNKIMIEFRGSSTVSRTD